MQLSSAFKQGEYYPALLMGVVALIVTTLLMLSHMLTKEPIAQRQREDLTRLLDQVLPTSLYDNEPLDHPYQLMLPTEKGETALDFYRAKKAGKTSAVMLFTASAGYSGDIKLLVAIKADGSLSGVRAISHTETPGLGDKIELSKSDWILSFNHLSLTNPTRSGWAVKKDGGQFDAFTGATITPRAVVKGVVNALDIFEHHKAFFLEAQNDANSEAPVTKTLDNAESGSGNPLSSATSSAQPLSAPQSEPLQPQQSTSQDIKEGV